MTLFDGVNSTLSIAEKKVLRMYADIKFEYKQEYIRQNLADEGALGEEEGLPQSIDAF